MRSIFKTTGSMLKQTVSDWIDDRAPRLGAALAYYTVFSTTPLIIIVIAIAGFWFGREVAQQHIFNQISSLVGNDGAMAIQGMLQAADNKPKTGLVASAVAVVMLLFGATGVFLALQDALNTIWEVRPKPGRGIRGFVRTRLLSLAMVFSIGFLLLVSLVVSTALSAAGQWIESSMKGGSAIWQAVNFLISFVFIAALFALMFKFVPDVKVAWRDVWLGGLITSFLFSIGKYALGLYLGRASVSSAYGAAGSLIVVLLWVYYSAQIVFLGAEFTQVFANRFGRKIEPKPNAMWATGQSAATAGGV